MCKNSIPRQVFRLATRYKFNFTLKSNLYLILTLILVSACGTTKYLEEGEVLLNENKIEFDQDLKGEKRRDLSYELSTVTQQKPNTKFLGLFRTRLWMYYSSRKGKQTKFKKWIQRKVAESPSIYSEKQSEKTAESMQYYLNNKGYFNAVVTPSNDLPETVENPKNKTPKIVEVTYTVNTNRMYRVDSASLDIPQNDLRQIIDSSYSETLLKSGAPIDNQLFDKEKNRITRELRERGYAFFYPNYIKFLSYDSLDYKADVTTRILSPTDSTEHQAYTIDDVYIYPDYYPGSVDIPTYDTTEVEGYKFVINKKNSLRDKPILDAVFIKKNRQYTQTDYDDTARKLDDLGIYKFISVQLSKPKPGNKVDAYILLTPRKRMELGYDVELNTDNGGVMGTAVSLGYRNRNLFKGAEVLRINSNFGLDFFTRNQQGQARFTGVDFGIDTELYLPKFLVPFRLRDITRRNDPRTRFALNYNYFDRLQYFRSQLFTFSFGYEWNETFTKKHSINPFNINYFQVGRIQPDFQLILNNNPYLDNSFADQLFPGITYEYTYTGLKNPDGSSWFFQGQAETSGNFVGLLDAVIKPDQRFAINNTVAYSQFARFEADVRFYQNITRRNSIAARLMSGVAFHYGQSEAVPYVKQFSSGGVSGIRAWRIRNLGPGGWFDEQATNNTSQAYQTGDVKLEANLEYRFHLVSYLKGALFVDAGNIWLREEDPDRPGGQFSNDFYKNIAIGTGIGFRFDYSYFVIRLDVAYKVRNPYPDENGKYWYYNNAAQEFDLFGDAVYNLAIGYPF